MKSKRPNLITDAAELRQLAEQKVAAQSAVEPITLADEKKLLHELQVHQIELEMLYEDLKHAHSELEYSWARYFDLYDLAPLSYLTISDRDTILDANLTTSALLGLSRNKLIKQPLSRFINATDQDIYYKHRQKLLETGNKQSFELHLIKQDGVPFWVRVDMNQAQDCNKQQVFRVVLTDINQQKANDEYLRQAATMFEAAREGMMVTDAQTYILVVNHSFSELTGFSATDVLGRTPNILRSGRQDNAFYDLMWATIHQSGYWQGEVWNRRKSGEIYPQILSVSAVKNEHNLVTHYVGVFSDITQLKSTEARLEFLAHHDPLTGLSNRILLFSHLEHCIALSGREHKSAALLIMDLDRFKDVNDSFGHLAGDELLQKVACRLTSRLRRIDTITRLGGDEFAFLLEDLPDPQDAGLVAAEIIDILNTPWSLANGVEVRMSASIGISLYPDHGRTSEELLQHADTALYRAKAEGRGIFKYFSEEMTKAALRRINLESLLRRALIREELMVYYQPQVDISSGAIIGAEVLLRWNNQEEGMIPPSQFIPVAEETGLISQIGEWVLKKACQQGRQWLDSGLPPLRIAVNLSLHQFRHGDLANRVEKILYETGFPPKQLELELTESALMERESEAMIILGRLRTLGVRLAIDDFGTGYSSLAHLKRFPLDILKIDKSFVDDIPDHEDDNEIAAAIIGMAHTLRLKVMAEGVETEEQLNFLRGRGCDYYQGYYKSPAVPAEAFEALISAEGILKYPQE